MQRIRSSLQSIGLNRDNKVQQLAIGSVAGFATGYLAMKVGKKVAFLVGGSIILFQVAQIRGLTKSNWEDARNKAKSVTDSLQSHSVALIFGISGGCRMDELVRMTPNDVEDLESKLLISIPDSKTNKPRSFVVNQMYLNLYRKYVLLRPENMNSERFSLNIKADRVVDKW
ncbi:fun14 domain containing [Holotrichia oblita]|uniref:Fun14 domain containing n=1 Tax=Holotrichia oblita TaxID=644536 RepID=A0ACB9T5N3_HOLOL|nr:fun14 domain containing [Holotrichia oblita]